MASHEQDEAMVDAEPTGQTPGGESEVVEEIQDTLDRIRMVRSHIHKFEHQKLIYLKLPGGTDTAASFEFVEEDHTLGNALRHIIMKKYASLHITRSRWTLIILHP